MGNLIDLAGQKFGRLTVIKRVYPNRKGKYVVWLCKCECGKDKIIVGQSLTSNHTKSCGCLSKELVRDRRRIAFGLASMRALITNYKQGAKRRKLEFKLTEEQFAKLTQENCFYCDAEPNNRHNHHRSFGDYVYNGLDRVDNAKGCTMDNVVPCCIKCNRAKDISTQQDFKNWIKKAYNNIFLNEKSTQRR